MKIKELSDNYKSVFETLNTEKHILIKNNQTMTAELVNYLLFSWKLEKYLLKF